MEQINSFFWLSILVCGVLWHHIWWRHYESLFRSRKVWCMCLFYEEVARLFTGLCYSFNRFVCKVSLQFSILKFVYSTNNCHISQVLTWYLNNKAHSVTQPHKITTQWWKLASFLDDFVFSQLFLKIRVFVENKQLMRVFVVYVESGSSILFCRLRIYIISGEWERVYMMYIYGLFRLSLNNQK